jgi:hypothetical protein
MPPISTTPRWTFSTARSRCCRYRAHLPTRTFRRVMRRSESRASGGTIYVTYALQDAERTDDVPGMGHGFVDAYDTAGNLLRRVASRGTLSSPWGLVLAPADFGKFGDSLLIGNFGDGRIHAYDPGTSRGNGESRYRGMLHSDAGPPLEIEGLWALGFGNGAAAGPTGTLFFTAGLLRRGARLVRIARAGLTAGPQVASPRSAMSARAAPALLSTPRGCGRAASRGTAPRRPGRTSA